MKKFELFRYIKRFSILILVVAVIGTWQTYAYIKENQRYTATVTIQYKNSGITEGYTPDGKPLDATEIYSAPVISRAIDLLETDVPLNMIRSKCSVEEIIPDDQQKINDALLEKGESVTYFPDKYKVSFVVEENYGSAYAKNALDAIMQSYCTYYTEKYVEQPISFNPSSNLVEDGYEYYQCVSILEDDTLDMLEYLRSKKEDYPDFRSSKTGYTFADLYGKYCQLRDYYIPNLYSKVLTGPQIKDGNVLREYLTNSISNSQTTETNALEKRALIKTLIDKYVERNKEIYGGAVEDTEEYDSNVLKQVDENYQRGDKTTTYDELIMKLVSIDKDVADEKIDREFLKEVSAAFGDIGTGSSGTAKEHEEVENLINEYEKELLEYYDIVKESGKELNLSLSADYLKMVSSVRVYQSINTKLYLALAIVLFLIAGSVVAVILGRIGDLLYYLIYIDKKAHLPNRSKVNEVIDAASKKLLPTDYSCISIVLENLSDISKHYGYSAGDRVLSDFSSIIALIEEEKGFVGYNGAGEFIAFMENCESKRAGAIISVIRQQVAEYNEITNGPEIIFRAAHSTTTTDGIYEARSLLRLTIRKRKMGDESQRTGNTEQSNNDA